MPQIMTQDEARLTELRRRYAVAWYSVQGQLTAIRQLVEQDFPAPDGEPPTRYDVDALTALRCELGALLERG